VLELTELQQAYWIGEQGAFELGDAAPHLYQELDIDGCDVARLEGAWRALVLRHEMLRSRITPEGRLELLAEVGAYAIEVIDERALGPDAVRRRLEALRADLTHHGPPSREWPPFRLVVSRIDDHRGRLHLSVSLLVTDAWGLAILVDELHRLYVDPRTTLPSPQPIAEIRARIAAQRRTEAFERSLAYWRRRVDGLRPGPELPYVRPPGSIASTRSSLRSWTLPAALAQQLRARAAAARLTPAAAICTAYVDVLAAHSRSRRFMLNTLVSMRPRLRALDVVDNLSATLLLEVSSSSQQTFAERASALLRQTMTDLSHAAVCGIQVAREAARSRAEGARVAHPVVFAGLNDVALTPGWRKVYDRVQTVQVLLDYSVEHEPEGDVHAWEVVDEAFPPGLADSMFSMLCERIERLASAEEAWRAKAGPGIPAAQQAVRSSVNATAWEVTDDLLHTGFFRRAAEQPNAPAVITEARTLTYRELARTARQVAHRLRRVGVTREDRVAVAMHRGWEQVAAVLGVLQAGGSYVPLDPTYPRDRIAYILHKTAARAVLTQAHARLEPGSWPAGCEAIVVELGADEVDDAAAPAQAPDDLAYIIFTSGSTGSPKGVAISHRGAVNTIRDINERFSVAASDRVLALSLLGFDLSVYDIFGILAAGGAVVVLSPDQERSPRHWLDLVQRHGVTIWNSVPAFMQLMVSQPELRQLGGWPRLRLVMLSGDWIPVTLPAQVREVAERAKIYSLGGATEASIWSIIHPIEEVDPSWPSIPYGRPLRNQRWYVLDEDLEDRPELVPGQLFIGGVGLARGYWGDEALTRDAFIEHPRTGERLYRTGDWGRYHPGGDLEFLGRDDGQVKLRGFRIELGEIEAVLRGHRAVREAVVSVRTSGTEKRLVAYLVPDRDPDRARPSLDQLRDLVRSKLPEYMVPSAFVFMEALPLSANGKVDRRELPDLAESAGALRARPCLEPRTDLERELVEAWEEILGQRSIGVTDNFFEIGGDSLFAVRLMARIKQRYRIDLPISILFERATIESIAQLLAGPAGTPAVRHRALVPIRPAGGRRPLFLVHPSGGGVLCYEPLARLLPADQPIFGLEGATSDPGAPRITCEEIAAHYVAAIRERTPAGPHRLGGWSSGGVVAFEMARQLADAGEAVEALVLIDSWVPVLVGDDSQPSPADLLASFARDLCGGALDDIDELRAALRTAPPAAQLDLVEALAARARPEAIPRRDLERLFRAYATHVQASARYRPRALDVPVILIRTAERRFEEFPDPARWPTFGWDRIVPRSRIAIEVVPGHHDSVLDPPNVEAVAMAIERRLAERGE
jgi:amino acid adenylation domain-containing protein